MRTEGNVNRKDFRYIIEQLSFVVFIDLFASRLNKLLYFMSNRPHSECFSRRIYPVMGRFMHSVREYVFLKLCTKSDRTKLEEHLHFQNSQTNFVITSSINQ